MCKTGQDANPTTESAMADLKQAGERVAGIEGARINRATEGYIRQDGLYMHYKQRDIYRVVCISIMDELEVGIVTYQSLKDGGYWSRTIKNFNGHADQYGRPIKRFTYIGQSMPG